MTGTACPASPTIRVATYNIQKSIGLDARRQPQRILDVIAEIDPDILAVQEVDRRFGERQTTLPLQMIADRTDLCAISFAPHQAGIGWHGNAILVRKSAQVLSQRRLTLPQLEPRGGAIATVEVRGRRLQCVAMHLSLTGYFRRLQIIHAVGELGTQPETMPTVIMGDFNDWYGRSRSLRSFGPGYEFVPTGPSFPAPMPVATLDRIIVSRDLSVSAAAVHSSKLARMASDHLPVWADLGMPEAAAAAPR
ncbi:MAG: endonuclease/exonuclease/phosphatase family protein [Sneathiellaceae bacterium]